MASFALHDIEASAMYYHSNGRHYTTSDDLKVLTNLQLGVQLNRDKTVGTSTRPRGACELVNEVK